MGLQREDITLNFDWSPQEVAVLRSQDFAQLCEQLKDEARQRHNPKTSRCTFKPLKPTSLQVYKMGAGCQLLH